MSTCQILLQVFALFMVQFHALHLSWYLRRCCVVVVSYPSTHVTTADGPDFSKVFDRINHTIAVEKLIHLGVDRSIIPVICSFLTDCSQTVCYCGVASSELSLTCGVPQGNLG